MSIAHFYTRYSNTWYDPPLTSLRPELLTAYSQLMYNMNLHVYFAKRRLFFPLIRAYFSVFPGTLQVGVLPDTIGAQLGSGRAIERAISWYLYPW